jgi:hypothetical protein
VLDAQPLAFITWIQMSGILVVRATDGAVVAEADLGSTDVTVDELVAAGRAAGATLVWAHGGDLAAHGFRSVHGYARLHVDWNAKRVPAHKTGIDYRLSTVDIAASPELLTEAFLDQWGHKQVHPPAVSDDDGSVVLGLAENSRYVGICQFWPGDRIVDGPGVIPAVRSAQLKVHLLRAVCALLGDGPVDLDTWGEDDETIAAYMALGFQVVVRELGWELRLT